ncbi:hypothetical protein MRX96_005988 [Rhipicephalus microplus]
MTRLQKKPPRSTDSGGDASAKSQVTFSGKTFSTGGVMDVKGAGKTSELACMQAAAESLTSAKETDVLNDATAATDESESSTQTVQKPAEGGAIEWHDAEEPGTGRKRPRDDPSTKSSDMSNQ